MSDEDPKDHLGVYDLRQYLRGCTPEEIERMVANYQKCAIGIHAGNRADEAYFPSLGGGWTYDPDTTRYLPLNYLEGADRKCRPS